ncbi:MAG TPA: hypothetical protein VMW15_08785 [Terracidiphilus sp.]|nr:hypothetical protein [Terracidiphilus sp.]
MLFTAGYTPEQAKKMEDEPRAYGTWQLHGNGPDHGHSRGRDRDRRQHDHDRDRNGRTTSSPTLKRDWSVSLGAGGVAAGMSPAKYNFDVNATPSCTADFAVFPVDASTGSSRANVTGTFSTTTQYTTGTAVSVTVTPTGGSAVTLSLTPSTSSNTGTNFQVYTSGTVSTNADSEAINLAAAINRNLSGTALGEIAAVRVANTVVVYALTPGTEVVLTDSADLNNFGWGSVTDGTNGSQANIVGFNELYSGTGSPLCTGYTYPSFIFSYASGVGPVATSPTISLDGTEIAYVENDPNIGAIFHVLTWGSGTETGTCTNNGTSTPTCSLHPAVPGSTSGSNARDYMLPLGLVANATTGSDTYSSPFVNYSNDTAYVGDDAGFLYSITPVFLGSQPAHAGGNFPVTVSSGNNLSAPVLDVSGTGNIFVGDSNGTLYNYVADGSSVKSYVVGTSNTAGGIKDGPVVDSTNSVVYAADGCNTGFGGSSVLDQIGFTSSTLSLKTAVSLSSEGCSGPITLYSPAPDNKYYNTGIGSGTASSNGELLIAYASTGGSSIAQFQFTSGTMSSTAQYTVTPYTTAGASNSPVTEFYSSDISYTPSAISQSGNTVTVTTPTNAFVDGQIVTIAGVTSGSGGCTAGAAAAIDGQATITVTNPTTFTFTSSVSATFTGATGNQCTLTSASATGPTVDYAFFGISLPEVFTYTLPLTSSSQSTTAFNTTSATGGTSAMIVDNDSASGQAASIYYGTQLPSITQCGSTAAFCAVKLTQSGLN